MPESERLAGYRAEIDACDGELVQLLARRFAVTEKVGKLKARGGLPAADPAREAEQRDRIHALAIESGLDPRLAESVWRHIVQIVKQRHLDIAQAH